MWGGSNAFDLSAYIPTGVSTCTSGHPVNYSIVGQPSSNGTYTDNETGTTLGSANRLNTGCDGTMFYESATFTLSIAGLNATNFATLSNVVFGFGPDSPNNPDGDDYSTGVICTTCGGSGGGSTGSTIPEPASIVLLGSILAVISTTLRKKKASLS
jgi:hypothetical protein